MLKICLSIFLWGLFFGSGSCIASCGPILVTYIAGTRKDNKKSLLVYFLFSLARIFTYLGLSLLIYFLGVFATEKFLGNIFKYVLILGGLFIILIGFLMMLGKNPESKTCGLLKKKFLEQDKKTIIAFGLAIGLIPCAPLLAVLSYIGLVSKGWAVTLLYSFSFGLGTLLSPLILLVMLAGLIPRWLKDKASGYNRIFNFICGLIIVILGVKLLMRVP
ncbi:MAG: sulfite exporter TauE/SafE family protein [Candidatus Omnitrophota bacterium]